MILLACKGDKGDKGDQGDVGPQGPSPIVATNAGLTGDGSSSAPLAVSFGSSGSATTVARSDHAHVPATGANLMIDTASFNWIPPGQTNVTTGATYGAWHYYPYNASTASRSGCHPAGTVRQCLVAREL